MLMNLYCALCGALALWAIQQISEGIRRVREMQRAQQEDIEALGKLRPLLEELVAYRAEQFDGAGDLDVSGSDTVDWLLNFRLRVRRALEATRA